MGLRKQVNSVLADQRRPSDGPRWIRVGKRQACTVQRADEGRALF
jgi:hypothetical protein